MLKTSRYLLNRTYFLLYAIFRRVVRRPWTLILLVAVCTAAAYPGLNRLRYFFQTEAVMDSSFPSSEPYRKLKQDIAVEDRLTFLIRSPSPIDADGLCKLEKWRKDLIRENKSIRSESSLFGIREILWEDGKLFYPQVAEAPCKWGEDVAARMARFPLAWLFFDRDFKSLVFHFEIFPLGEATAWGDLDYEAIRNVTEAARATLPQGFQLDAGGSLYFQHSIREGILGNRWMNLASALCLFFGIWFFFRRLSLAFLGVSMVAATNFFLRAGMGWMGHPIDPLSSCLFLMMSIAVVEDFVFFNFSRQVLGLSARGTLRRLLVPGFWTSFTTAVGFGSLTVAKQESVRHFAFWTAAGTMIEWALLFLVLAALYSAFPKLETLTAPRIPEKLLARLNRISGVSTGPFLAKILLLPLPLLLFSFENFNTGYNPLDSFLPDHALVEFRDRLRSDHGLGGEISVVFSEKISPEKESSLTGRIRELEGVVKVASYQDVLSGATKDLPDRLHTLIEEDLRRSTIGKIFYGESRHRALAFIGDYETETVATIQEKIAGVCGPDCEPAGELLVTKDYAQSLIQTLHKSFFLSLAIVLGVVLFLHAGVGGSGALAVVASTIWAPFMLMLFMIAFQIKVNVVTCVALSLLVGLAGDNVIQFLLLSRKKGLVSNLDKLGTASLKNTLLWLAIALCLLLSDFRTTRILSGLLILGTVLLLIGDVWLLRGLLKKNKLNERV